MARGFRPPPLASLKLQSPYSGVCLSAREFPWLRQRDSNVAQAEARALLIKFIPQNLIFASSLQWNSFGVLNGYQRSPRGSQVY